MRMETFIRRTLELKAHTVARVEADEAERELVVQIDRLGQRPAVLWGVRAQGPVGV